MADQIEVGDLVVRLIADAKQLETALKEATRLGDKFSQQTKKGMKGAEKASDDLGKSLSELKNKVVGLAAAYFSVSTAINTFRSSMTLTNDIDRLSQVSGISANSLGELRGVVLQLGIDFSALSQAVVQFAPKMTEALASPTSRGAQAAKALGIALTDAAGNIKGFDQVLSEVADKFPQYADGANKAAIASALFGEEAGPRLIPLLNRGRASLEELRRAVGQTFSDQDIQKSREYQQAIGQVQIAWEKFAREVAITASGPVSQALTKMAELLQRFNAGLQAMQKSDPEFDRLEENLAREAESLAELVDLTTQLMRRREADKISREQYIRQSGPLIEAIDKVKARMDAIAARMKEITALQSGIGKVGTDGLDKPPAPALDPFALEKAQFALERLTDRLNGQRDLFDPINLSWKTYSQVAQDALKAIDAAHEKNHQREQARFKLEQSLRKQDQAAMLQTAELAAQAITTLWPKQKGAAIAAAVINTAVGITKALSSVPPPWSFAQAALIGAMGAAQIAQIQSTNADGGGATTAAPTASTPAAPPDTGPAAPTRALSIEGIDPSAIFTGRQLEDLISRISAEVQNGAVLVSTRNLPR